MHDERYENERTTRRLQSPVWLAGTTATALGAAGLALLYARRYGPSKPAGFGLRWSDEGAVTIRDPLEGVESAWSQWCNSGQSGLSDHYAVRFQPAPGARGTEVHLSSAGTKGEIQEELRRFKQFVETGEVVLSDSPGLRRAAQPAASRADLIEAQP